ERELEGDRPRREAERGHDDARHAAADGPDPFRATALVVARDGERDEDADGDEEQRRELAAARVGLGRRSDLLSPAGTRNGGLARRGAVGVDVAHHRRGGDDLARLPDPIVGGAPPVLAPPLPFEGEGFDDLEVGPAARRSHATPYLHGRTTN